MSAAASSSRASHPHELEASVPVPFLSSRMGPAGVRPGRENMLAPDRGH